jgi:demethylmenaquinone methyltransferase/2-methoxy-6-polyprenyl-1,4-benzoquinol methylase
MRLSNPGSRRPDPVRAQAQYRGRADRYDLELAAFEPVRKDAIALLDVPRGGTVLDVGCGTGLSFGLLKDKLGPQGRIVGIEPSPDMLTRARMRVGRQRWSGITLLAASAANAPLHGKADGALFHFTHDVLRDAASLDHVFAHLKPGARVVATGLQWAPAWLPLTNLFVLGAAMYSVTCMAGLGKPWDLLADRLCDVQVRPLPWMGLYITTGRVAARAAS